MRDLAENSVSYTRTAGRRIKEACSNVGLAACMEESSESGSGHSNRLLGFEAILWASNVVTRGQGPKQRFSWQEAMALGDGSGTRELTVLFPLSCFVSRFVLSFRKGKEKEALKGEQGNSPGQVQTLRKDWPRQAYEGDEFGVSDFR